ncbi:ABC transporter substrate-binding protein [Brevibacillus marinus]|uniref:ABC transporter substrate-binding protein n=1 Tax=Brevibacillus marinus TaxID=2496837 RepID=UPI003B978B3A
MVGKKSRMIMRAGILLLLLAIAGCGGQAQEGANSAAGQASSAQPAAAEQPSEKAAEQQGGKQETRTVQHAMGTTEITGTPARVVTLYQGATDAALLLGVKPVGAVESWIEQPWYYYIREQMEGVTNLGSENQPNLEEIIKLKPDVIIGSKTRHEKIYEQLSAIAPTVMEEEVHVWKATLHLVAEALNKQAEEAKFLADWNKKVADFQAKLGDRLKNTEVAIVDFRPDHVRIVHSGFSALVLDELGIPRPANQKSEEWGVKLTSKESIPEMDADIIFDQTSKDRDDGRLDVRKEWMAHPLWQNLRAVKNNQVYEVDTAIWNNGSGPIAATKMLEDLYRYFGLQ